MSGPPTTDAEISGSIEDVDCFYRALADHRRRIAIRVLEERESMALEELADAIAAREPGESDRDAIEISLLHQHLPLLTEAGIVTHDADTGRVTARSAVDDVMPFGSPPVQ